VTGAAPEPCVSVYVTLADRRLAARLGRALVEERLAACANVLDGLTSIYRWEGAVHSDPEAALLLKTRAALFPQVEARLRALHTYELPCIVAWPIIQGSAAYLAWVAEQTREP
jgi:periplasmic divalent cation tolerance protein